MTNGGLDAKLWKILEDVHALKVDWEISRERIETRLAALEQDRDRRLIRNRETMGKAGKIGIQIISLVTLAALATPTEVTTLLASWLR